MPKFTKKSLTIFIYFALAISTLLVFWQVRNFDFTNYDDNLYVYENPHVLHGLTYDGLMSAFTSAPAYGNWLPLTWLSFMLDCQLFGASPGPLHLVNVFLHIANTLLLFAVLKKMTAALWPSAFVAAAFALHPMHVESVAWVTERKDVLSVFFFLLTLAAYTSYVRRPSVYRYLVTLVLFELGLLAKPMLVTLPFVLLLLDYWPLNRFPPKAVKTSGRQSRSVPAPDRRKVLYRIIIEKVPFLALSAVSSVITFLVQQGGGAVVDFNSIPFGTRVANAFVSYAEYIGKMFWPTNLAVFYPFPEAGLPPWQITLSVLLLVVISIFVICFGRGQKYLPVGWFWFVGTLIPVIGLVQVGDQALADRYTYISYIGLFIMIAWGLPELLSKLAYRKIVLGMSMVILLTMLGICTFRQVSYWKNSTTLFSHAIDVTKNNYLAYTNLGEDLYSQGKVTLAIEYYTKSLQIQSNFAYAHNNLGLALGKQGNYSEAIAHFRQAVQLKPDMAEAQNNLGLALAQQGKYAEARAHFAQAVQLRPDLAKARNNLAKVLVVEGQICEALDQFREAIRLKPDWPDFMNDFAFLVVTHPELKSRDVNEAIRLASRACELTNYKNTAFLSTLAVAYSSANRFYEAAQTLETALNLDPNSAALHNGLGDVLLSQGKFKEAIGQMQRSLEIEPNNPDAKSDMAWILATCPDSNMRNPSEAIRLAQESCIATNYRKAGKLDALGAAYASAGRFDEAIEMMQKALGLVDKNDKYTLEQFHRHLDLYKVSKPYIETRQKDQNAK